MNGKANYAALYVSADEVENIDLLAERARRILETANGYYIAARTLKDAQVVDPMRLSLIMQISQKLRMNEPGAMT